MVCLHDRPTLGATIGQHSPAMSLSAVLATARPIDRGFSVVVPDTWLQGRTAYGGFSAALALSAALGLGGDLPPLRSAQVSFVGPLSGEIAVRATVLRRGRNASWIVAEVTGAAGLGLTAQFVFMGALQSAVDHDSLAPPRTIIPVETARAVVTSALPAFLVHNFECRFATPRPDEAEPELCWWIRLRNNAALDPTVALILCADALPPGVLPLMPRQAPLSSMQWQINLLTPLSTTRDGWWLMRSSSDFARSGGSSQTMQVWNADLQAIAAGVQSVALFG